MANKRPPQPKKAGQLEITYTDRRARLTIPDTAMERLRPNLSAVADAAAQAAPEQTTITMLGSGASARQANITSVGTDVVLDVTPTLEANALRFWRLPEVNPNFIDREVALNNLANQLQQTGNVVILGKRQSCVDESIDEAGKTQLALAFAHRHQQKQSETAAPSPISVSSTAKTDSELHYDAILWLRASNLIAETKQLAKACGVDTEVFEEDTLCQEICRRLTRLGQRILLVFDDVDEATTLEDWLGGIGACHDNQHSNTIFHLLATSRREYWQGWACVRLDVLTEAEAFAQHIIFNRYREGNSLPQRDLHQMDTTPSPESNRSTDIEQSRALPGVRRQIDITFDHIDQPRLQATIAASLDQASPAPNLLGDSQTTQRQSVGTGLNLRFKDSITRKALRVWNMPSANFHFIGRDDMLCRLDTLLQSDNNQTGTKGYCIVGLGGIGKTQLALAFARRHQPIITDESSVAQATTGDHELPRYDATIWLRAQHLAADTQRLAKACNIDPTTAARGTNLCQAICHKLEVLGQRILWVFDDVSQESDLADWTSTLNAYHRDNTTTAFHTLVTSRNLYWQIQPTLVLDGFSRQTACDFIRQKSSGKESDDAVGQLAELLHGFPLALDQAMTKISTLKMSIARYCRSYLTSATNQIALLKAEHHDSRGTKQGVLFHTTEQQTTYNTWYLSIAALRRERPLAETVLNLCAFLAPVGIPSALMTGMDHKPGLLTLSQAEWTAIVIALKQQGLIRAHNADATVFDIHPLLQTVIRLHLREQPLNDAQAQAHLAGLPGEAITNHAHPSHCDVYYGCYLLDRLTELLDPAHPLVAVTTESLYRHGEQLAILASAPDNAWDPSKSVRLQHRLATFSKTGRQLWQACQTELGPQTAADTTQPTTPPMRLSQSQDTLFGHPETKTEPPPTEPARQAFHPMTHQSQLGDDAAPSLAPA